MLQKPKKENHTIEENIRRSVCRKALDAPLPFPLLSLAAAMEDVGVSVDRLVFCRDRLVRAPLARMIGD